MKVHLSLNWFVFKHKWRLMCQLGSCFCYSPPELYHGRRRKYRGMYFKKKRKAGRLMFPNAVNTED